MLQKSFPVTLLPTPADAPPGQIEAIVAVRNNVDRGRERIKSGFFAESLARKLPKGCWGHDWLQPIAKTEAAEEWLPGDPRLPEALRHLGGYYIRAVFNLDTQRGREAHSDVKFGIVDEFSIGYDPTETDYSKTEDVLDLIKGEWFEWSPVLVGMNPATALVSIKGATPVKRGSALARVKALYDNGEPSRWEVQEILCLLLDYVSTGDLLATADPAALLVVDAHLTAARAVVAQLLQAANAPASKSAPVARVPFDVQAARTESAVTALVARVAGWDRARRKEGRQISAANLARLVDIPANLRAEADKLDKLIEDTKPPEKSTAPADDLDWGTIQLTTQRHITRSLSRV